MKRKKEVWEMRILETERLVLRPWDEEDYEDLYEYARSELVGPYAGWTPHENEDESRAIIRMFQSEEDVYAIVLKEENKVVGSIGLHFRTPDANDTSENQREIGFVLNPRYWGRGIVPEAVERILEYGFHELGLDLIWCGHFDFNEKSKRVVEKCGFQFRFQKKTRLKHYNDQDVEVLLYSMTKEAYDSRQHADGKA